jgi:hypothetical protein
VFYCNYASKLAVFIVTHTKPTTWHPSRFAIILRGAYRDCIPWIDRVLEPEKFRAVQINCKNVLHHLYLFSSSASTKEQHSHAHAMKTLQLVYLARTSDLVILVADFEYILHVVEKELIDDP